MAELKIQQISKHINGHPLLTKIDLAIPQGKFFALLGPSGCGKTTLLRIIAGLDTMDEGKILLEGKDVSQVPPYQRPINVVFQNYALFPHLNVFENIAYPLRIQKKSQQKITEKVSHLLASFHLESETYKHPHQLSGGQQQRVAIARAIVGEPKVLLLDEPLAALDFKLREKMLLELIELQDRLKTTFVYVTHDQFEALTVADTMAIMNKHGKIEQIGSPNEIYEFPQTTFVANFVGNTNLFEGTITDLCSETQDIHLTVPGIGPLICHITKIHPWVQLGAKAHISIRPEKICITKSKPAHDTNLLQGTVHAIVYHGRSTQYNIQLSGGKKIQVFEQNEDHISTCRIDYDDKVFLYWNKNNGVLLCK